jgi:hypothetical protein
MFITNRQKSFIKCLLGNTDYCVLYCKNGVVYIDSIYVKLLDFGYEVTHKKITTSFAFVDTLLKYLKLQKL